MNWKNTWILVGLAGALCAFIMLFERRLQPTGYVPPPAPLFADFKPGSATTLQIRRGTQFAIILERTNGIWHFTRPFAYPAAGYAVQSFLEALERMAPATRITEREVIARKQTAADFGFDPPPIVVVLEKAGARPVAVRFGARTPANDQVYVQVDQQPYAVVSAEILEKQMPRTQHDWRDTALFHFGDERIDSAEIARGAAGFKLALDSTNRLWRLVKPFPLRADQLQVQQLLNKIRTSRALEFVTDEALVDLEPYGLQTPEFEVTLASGDAGQKVQFGHAPTNDPSRVYARMMARTNIVLVPKSIVDLLATPHAELRERQLITFAPEMVDLIDARGEEAFTVRKSASGAWLAGDLPVDPPFMAQWLNILSDLQASDFVKDVVTDFAAYGLGSPLGPPPERQYALRTVVTNASGPTNVLIARLDFGTRTNDERVFVRRWDEDSVYAIRQMDYTLMPSAAWQLRDHRIWSFSTNQVARITVTEAGNVREVLRQPNGEWITVKGFARDANPFALEELAFRLGDLRAYTWVARGVGAREKYGFTTNGTVMSIELRGDKPQTLNLEFGGRSPLLQPYALATIDGQPTVFVFPWQLYVDLQIANLAPAGVKLLLPKGQ